ncbi:TPA: HK97 gp10 family phage protein [Streptococcus suis]|nr:HK97 gp10 family phage protein [Streptococcus suis]
MSVTYRVKGLKRYLNQVQQMPNRAQQAVNRELSRSSLRVELRAKELAPWDTGWMSLSIYSAQYRFMVWMVSSPVDYSIYVELGTRYQSAQPFLFPALEEEYPVLMRNLSRMFRR